MVLTPTRKKNEENTQKEPPSAGLEVPWKRVFIAAVPIALSVYYVAWVAPALVPLAPGVKVPFPAATRLLEVVCAWSGEHQWAVAFIGLGLLASGLVASFLMESQRYYVALAVFVSLALGFTYLSISAPIDRLLHAVEKSVPKDNRVPTHRAPAED